MKIRKCLKCMADFEEQAETCPVCGRAYGQWQAEDYALRPGSILEGKYLVGEMLGRGGFGITYLGYDLLLEQKVAIKEYFPMNAGFVTRDRRSTVVWNSAVLEKNGMEKSFDSFLKEARKMAKLGGIPGVVGVKSVFVENDTAYIVMDFVEGETLQKKLEREGPMDFNTCVQLLQPVIRALEQVHSHGIIHRDISPDNIMVQPDGKLVLLDLGAAKELSPQRGGTEMSSMLVAKHGFSPMEQYGRNGDIGPWTDVYAMAATIYYCCTGTLLPTAVERSMGEPLTGHPKLTEKQFRALSPALAIQPGKRTRNMAELSKRLEEAIEKNRKLPKCLLPALGALVVLLAVLVDIGREKPQQTVPNEPQLEAETIAIQTEVTTPPIEATEPLRKTYTMAVMKAGDYFWGQENYTRSAVKQIVFQSTMENVGADAWDVSADGDKSILAWMDVNTLYVAADGNIAPAFTAYELFSSFDNLKEVDFGYCFDTSQMTSMEGMFKDCSSLTSLDVSGFDTSQVKNMGDMFKNCSSLTSLNISGFDTSKVTNMCQMFYGCGKLTSLDVSGLDTSQVRNMDNMFLNCYSLSSLNVSGFDTSNVTDMGSMFHGCSGLTSLDVSGLDTSQVINMSWMFQGCSGLTNLDVSGFDTSQVIYMNWMFANCDNLTGLDVSGLNTSRAIYMNRMFYNCKKLTNLDVSRFNTRSAMNMGGMFRGCSSLTALNVSNFNTEKVTEMDCMFAECSSLTSLNASNFNTRNVINMNSMFNGCSSLRSLKLSNFVTQDGVNVFLMFFGCENLTDFQCSDQRILEEYRNR